MAWWRRAQRGPTSPGTRTGTLTFFFADIRGYTAFVERYGDEAAAALVAEYRRLVRAELAKAEGREVDTEGDALFAVFLRARQALGCAISVLREADRLTHAHPELPLLVGIGLHTGEAVGERGQFVGSAVNIAARLAQHAGAGELLVSEVVRGLVRGPDTPPMREREGLALKGVDEPPRLYSVLWPSAAYEAPAPVPRRPPAIVLGPIRVTLPLALAAGLVLAVALAGLVLARGAPTVAPAGAPAPAAAALPAKAGALLWQAALDEAGSELEPRAVTGDPETSAIRYRRGEIEVAILGAGAGTEARFKRVLPASFFAEMDLKVEPGSDLRFVWSMRRGAKEEHQVRIETQSEEIWISYVTLGVKSDRISGRVTVPALQTGRAIRVGVIADGPAYTLYLDGREITGAVDAKQADLATPFGIAASGKRGSVTILGLRVHALATTN